VWKLCGSCALQVLPASTAMLHDSVDAALWAQERDWENPRQIQVLEGQG
jgi:hypothetical protein